MRSFSRVSMVGIVMILMAACGHHDSSGTPPPAPASAKAAAQPSPDPQVASDMVSKFMTMESSGERPEEVQLSVRVPHDYGFSMPLKGSPAINYFYGGRVWSSLSVSNGLASGKTAGAAILIHAAENPQEALMDPVGHRRWEFHSGVDISAKLGTPIYAPADGVVFSVGNRACVGETVVLRHAVNETQMIVYTVYNHLQPGSDTTIKAGDIVKRGQKFAKTGQSGAKNCIDGAHLHFEIRTPIHGELNESAIENWVAFLQQTAKQNPADFVKEIDQACQARKTLEVQNALQVAKKESGAVAPLTAGRCSFNFESHQSVVLPIYRVFERDQIHLLGLR